MLGKCECNFHLHSYTCKVWCVSVIRKMTHAFMQFYITCK